MNKINYKNMSNIHNFGNATENLLFAKQKVIAAVAQDIVTSEDDGIIGDAMDMCNIIETHNATSSANAIYELGNTIRNTLLEINEIRERNRERRHKELMQVLTKMVQHDCDASTTECNMPQKPPKTNDKELEDKELEEHLEGEDLQHITVEYTVEELTHDSLIETDALFNIKTFDDSTVKCIKDSDDNGISLVMDPKQLLNNKKMQNTINVLKSERVSTLKSVSQLQPKYKQPIIKPIIHANRMVLTKKESKSDIQFLRAQMLEMQRKKMEDRERKKRKFLEI